MSERNRVTPTGEIVATPLRGAWTGNRGVLHEGREIVRSHGGNLWITCALEFRGRHRELWIPNRWTPLFFHDEAVAFADKHGLQYSIIEPHQRRPKVKSYADNFRYDRVRF